MSEQSFIGIAPTAPEGSEMYFHSLDSWIAVHEAIQRLVAEEFPFSPVMTSESATSLADVLFGAIADGSARLALEDTVAPYFDNADGNEEDQRNPAERRSDYADYLFELLEQFMVFLRCCGGCTVE
jgi:hypothetical protein